jgi:hypothetical protein
VTAKRLELLRELVPAASRVAVLVDPANRTYSESTLRETEAAARAIGSHIQVLKASTIGEINAAFATLVRETPDASCARHVGADVRPERLPAMLTPKQRDAVLWAVWKYPMLTVAKTERSRCWRRLAAYKRGR